MAERSVVVRLRANIDDFRTGMRQAGQSVTDFGRQVSGQGNATRDQMEQVGRSALTMSAGLLAGLGLSTKAAIDWESAWAGVMKTVDGSPEEMAELEGSLRDLATSLPATHGEIAAVAEAAGQLGVAREDITAFTETMIALGETTNLTSDEAATALAQMMNVMRSAPADVDRMASTLVALGNAGASTEADILNMAQRIAGAGQLVGATEADIMALASAMADLGIRSELGGSSMSRTITKIYTAVQEGGDALEGWAEVAGMTASDFAEAFETDPIRAIDAFVQGLGRIKDEGGNVVGTLQELDIKGTQDTQVMLALAGAGDRLTNSLALSADAWEENSALSEEASKRYETTAAQMQVLRNQVVDLAIDAGQVLLPALNGVVEMLGNVATGLGSMPGPMVAAGVGLAGISASALGLVGVVGVMAPKIIATRDALMAMGSAGQFAARNMRNMATGAAALGAAFTAVSMWTGMMEEARDEGRAFAQEWRDSFASMTSLDEIRSELSDMTAAQRELNRAADESRSPFDADYRASLRTAADEMGLVGLSQLLLIGQVEELTRATGVSEAEAIALVRAQAELGDSAGDTGADLNAMRAEMTTEEAQALADELGVTTDQLEEMASASEHAEEAIKSYNDTLTGLMNPLFGAVDALRANQEAQDAVTAAEWNLIAATEAYNVAVRDHGAASAEAESALMDMAAAEVQLQDAHDGVVRSAMDVDMALHNLTTEVEAGTLSVDSARTKLQEWVAAGWITQQQANNTAAAFDNVTKKAGAVPNTVEIHMRSYGFGQVAGELARLIELARNAGGAIGNATRLDKFHSGGVVPGRPGQEVPIIAMAGETVLPTHQTPLSQFVTPVGAATGGGSTVIYKIDASGSIGDREVARVVRDAIAVAGRSGMAGL